VINKEAVFMQVIEEHKGMLFRVCRIYQDDNADRDDLMQEIILQLWLVFESFKGNSKIGTWIYRVALNTAITYFKKQKRRNDTELLTEMAYNLPDHSLHAEKEEQLALFYAALKHLNKIEKALIFLYMESQPYNEIALNLGISEVNVRVRLTRIKNKLKEIIKNISYEHR
jgi:RNA polymerase sigma-70 factor (ECF subfamily)